MNDKFFTTQDDFEKLILNELPNVSSFEKIPTGWTNYVFMVTTQDNAKYIFRFPRNNFFANCMEKEVIFNNFIKDKIPVQTVQLILKENNGRLFTMHRMIEGITLEDVLDTITLEQFEKLAEDITNYLFTLQQIALPPVTQTTSQFLTELASVNNNPNYDFSRFDRLKEMEKPMLLVHGDFMRRNILLDNNYRLNAVIDYAFVSFSCNIIDLSRMVGSLPSKYHKTMLSSFKSKFNTTVNMDDLNYLMNLWKYVEVDYIEYMLRCHPDISLPT